MFRVTLFSESKSHYRNRTERSNVTLFLIILTTHHNVAMFLSVDCVDIQRPKKRRDKQQNRIKIQVAAKWRHSAMCYNRNNKQEIVTTFTLVGREMLILIRYMGLECERPSN